MSDKDFKVKNKLVVKGITTAGPVVSDASGNIDSVTYLATQYGGTGTSTSPNSGQFLYSASGTTYSPTTFADLVTPITYSADAPSSPVTGQIWVESDVDVSSYNPTVYSSISSNTSLLAFTRYFVTSASALTLTLPASPSLNDQIEIFDASGNAATYNITVSRNGNKINGNAGNLIIDTNGSWMTLVYTGSTYGWKAA